MRGKSPDFLAGLQKAVNDKIMNENMFLSVVVRPLELTDYLRLVLPALEPLKLHLIVLDVSHCLSPESVVSN